MPSALTWLSHDTAERDRTLRLIELFKESGTVDELGIGSIRDTFADAFFPGTSVLQTRARYLLFVPWLLELTAHQSRNVATAPERLRTHEVSLIHALLAGGESEGVIGRDAKASLKRMPSTLYDPALRRFGIRTTGTTLDQFFRDAATAAERRRHLPDADDDGVATRPTIPGLDPELAVSCPPPADLLNATTFQLTSAEASYLRDRIVQAAPGSLIAWLLSHEARADVAHIWEHPDLPRFPTDLRTLADHARRFHHATHGAALVYNLVLAEKKQSEELAEAYRTALALWQEEVTDSAVWTGWSLPEFWAAVHRHNPRVRATTVRFVEDWITGAQRSTDVATDEGLRAVVANREQRLKGSRSRLVNAAALDNWAGGVGPRPSRLPVGCRPPHPGRHLRRPRGERMSLAPESRTLLTDALQPPAGFRLDVAVATTYSVDLVALLLAPLSFAVHEHATDLETADPIAVLESVRRHADHLTVFCQAAAIHPTPYRSVLTFIEDSVVEVTAPRDGALFHPKVWAIRFRSNDGATRHRCLVLSRNLTFDQSWDTILVLDEPAPGEWTKTIDGALLGRFVAELPSLAVRPLGPERRAEIADLAATIGAAHFTVPAPYRAGEIVPLGMAGSEALSLDPSDRLLAISPFLGSRVVGDLQASTGELILLSRPAALDGVRLASHVQPFVLDQATEDALDASFDAGTGADASEQGDHAPVTPASEANPPARGLHAKTFLAERGGEVEVITGSANATTSAFDGNVELVVRLRGAKASAGIDTVWHGSKEAPGLRQVCVPYTPQAPDPLVAELEDRSWEIDRWHTLLSTSDPVLEVGESDGSTTTLTLHIGASTPPEGCVTRVRPLSLLESVEARELAPEITWRPISVRNVTPFLAVSTTNGTGKAAVSRTSVIKAELCGDVGERRQSALRDVLRSATDVLRYLVFLLGDPASTVTADLESMFGERWGGNGYVGAWDRVNIFEPLIRAAASGDRSVDRVASLLEELGADAAHDDLIPPEFAELWAVVDQLRRDDGGREAGR